MVLLADELFCIGHRDRTGRTRLHPRAGGLGLGAALLGELMLAGRVEIRAGEVLVVRRDAPADGLTHTVLDLLRAQPQHRALRTWLSYLSGIAPDAVAQRLIRAGVVEAVRHRRLWTTRVVYVPVDANRAVWPEVRLARLLVAGGPFTEADSVLAGLVAVTGLIRHVLWDPATYDIGHTHLVRAMARLSPSAAELVTGTEAAVGAATLAPH